MTDEALLVVLILVVGSFDLDPVASLYCIGVGICIWLQLPFRASRRLLAGVDDVTLLIPECGDPVLSGAGKLAYPLTVSLLDDVIASKDRIKSPLDKIEIRVEFVGSCLNTPHDNPPQNTIGVVQVLMVLAVYPVSAHNVGKRAELIVHQCHRLHLCISCKKFYSDSEHLFDLVQNTDNLNAYV